jgi:hypothetical protein
MTKSPQLTLICAVLIVASLSSALAQSQPRDEYRGTTEQQEACKPDVLKFCGPEIPNVERITQCLRYYDFNKKLSPACSAVFAEKRR